MQQRIIKLGEINEIAKKLHSEGKKIVLVGGCFDVLHIGHIDFLEKAKVLGDKLIVLLESDDTLTKLKGLDRPIHSLSDRARILSALRAVDIVFTLPPMESDKSYDDVIFAIKPDIIATTIGDEYRQQKQRQADAVSAQLVDIAKTANYSTSKIAKLLEKEI